MQEKFGGKGLTILAVTNEGTSDTEKWIEDKGAKYAYAYDKGGKLQRHFGVRGIPHAVLVDPTGTVVWRGHPGNLDEGTVQKSLQGAIPKPLWEWDGDAKGARKALQKGAFKDALEEAAKLGESSDGPAILAAIQGMVKAKIEGAQAKYDAGDFLGALEAAEAAGKELAGLPEGATAEELVARIEGDDSAKEVIKGQKKLAKLMPEGDRIKRKDVVKAIEKMRELKADYRGTFVEAEADRLIEKLNEMVSD